MRDMDYNPNRPHCIVSGGDDCNIKFWDLRKYLKPVKIMSCHSHWVWRTRYNPFHDQLILSSSTDSSVALWRASSVSSAPLLDLDASLDMSDDGDAADDDDDNDDDGGGGAESGVAKDGPSKDAGKTKGSAQSDCLVHRYEDHDDAVYSVAWSSFDAWVFASMSFDGRIVFNHVPSAEKYRVLL